MKAATPHRTRQSTSLGYKAANHIRKSGLPQSQGGTLDSHLDRDRNTLVNQANAFYRDNSIYHGIVNRAVDNILGEDGFLLNAQTESEDVNTTLEQLWEEFTRTPEVRGLYTWADCKRLILKDVINCGDAGAILTKSGQLQLIESERIGAPRRKLANPASRLFHGIEMNAVGRPLAYWVRNIDPKNSNYSHQYSRRYKADLFIFLANFTGLSQSRGVPALVPSFPDFARLDDILSSEAASWQIKSRIALAITKRGGVDSIAGLIGRRPGQRENLNADELIQDFGHSLVFYGDEGDQIAALNNSVPATQFTESVMMYIRILGLPLGLPLELILLDWSQVNYSSARAALEQAYLAFRTWQRLLINRWDTPIYKWKVNQWIMEGLVPPGTKDLFAHAFEPPPFPFLDAEKEIKALGERRDRGLATYSALLKSLNKNPDRVSKQHIQDVIRALDAAKEVQKAHPDATIPWEMFAGLKPPAPSKISTEPQQTEPKDDKAVPQPVD